MGIKGLTKLLAEHAPNSIKEQRLESYFGRTIAIDVSMSIYKFLVVVGRNGTEMLTNEYGEVTSHLQGMFNRTIRLLEAGLKPVYVFDGKPPDLKKHELAKRNIKWPKSSNFSRHFMSTMAVGESDETSPTTYSKRAAATEDLATAIEFGDKEVIEKFSKRTVVVNNKHNEDCKRLLRLMGVPVIEAPSEAEAECAALCKNGKVYAVATEDMDSLTFGTPRLLRYLMVPNSRKASVMEIELEKILEELNLNMDQFIDFCILCGCDYCDSIRGIGGQRGLKLIRQYGAIENIVENISKERYQMPDNWLYQEARDLFKEPSVSAIGGQLEMKWTAPDEAGLLTFLVNENTFNNDRVRKAIEKIKAANKKTSFWQAVEMIKASKNKVSQGRLYSFKPAMSVSAWSIKWKECASLKQESICMLGAPRPAVKSKMCSLQVCLHSMPKVIGSLNLPIPQLSFKHLGMNCIGVCLGT